MSWKRDIPFGYTMKMSKLVADDRESAIVKRIFSMYLSGETFKSISESMQLSGISYHADTCAWNKNMVKRILENARYIGDETYPQIIDPVEYKKARELSAEKRQNVTSCPEDLKPKLKKTTCSVCGARMYRCPKKGRTTRWACQNKSCGQSLPLSEDRFRTEIDRCFTLLAQSPTLLDPYTPDKQQVTPDVLRLQNELTAAFNRGAESPEYMRSLIFSLAAEQYKALPDMNLIHTLRELKDKIAAEGITEDNRGEIEQKAVRRILLGRESGVSIEFINGKIISSKEEATQ